MIEYKVRFMMDDTYEVVRIENTFLNEYEYDENEHEEENQIIEGLEKFPKIFMSLWW